MNLSMRPGSPPTWSLVKKIVFFQTREFKKKHFFSHDLWRRNIDWIFFVSSIMRTRSKSKIRMNASKMIAVDEWRHHLTQIASRDDSKQMLWDYEMLPVINCWSRERWHRTRHTHIFQSTQQFNGYTKCVRLRADGTWLHGYQFISEDQS